MPYTTGTVANNTTVGYYGKGVVSAEPEVNAFKKSKWVQENPHQPFPQNLKGLKQLLSQYVPGKGLVPPKLVSVTDINLTKDTTLLNHVIYKQPLNSWFSPNSTNVDGFIQFVKKESDELVNHLLHDYRLLSEDVDSFNTLVQSEDEVYKRYRVQFERLFETLTTKNVTDKLVEVLSTGVKTAAQLATAFTSFGISEVMFLALQPIATLDLFRTAVEGLGKDVVWKDKIAPHLRKIWDTPEISFTTDDPNLTFLEKIFEYLDGKYLAYETNYQGLSTLAGTRTDMAPGLKPFRAKEKPNEDKFETDDMKAPTRPTLQELRRKQVLFLFLYALFGPFSQSTSTDKFTTHSPVVANITYGIQQMQNRRTLEIAHRYNVQQIRLQLLEYTLFLKSLKENVAESAQNYLNEKSLELYSYYDIMGADNGRVVSTEETANLFFGGRKSRRYPTTTHRKRKQKLSKKSKKLKKSKNVVLV